MRARRCAGARVRREPEGAYSAKDTGHPFIQSFEPGEDWYFNFATEEMYGDGPELAG